MSVPTNSDNVTLWTATFADKDFAEGHDASPLIIFKHYNFDKASVNLLPTEQVNLGSHFQIPDVAPAGLSQALQDVFPGFSLDLLWPMLQSPNSNNALLPLGRSATDFSFFMRYAAVPEMSIGGDPTTAGTFDSCQVRPIPVAVWLSSSKMVLTGPNQSKPPVPVVILVCQNSMVRVKLSRHLAREHHRRLRRLMQSPSWIYLDLSFVLSEWQEIWELATGSIVLRDAQLTGKVPASSFLDLTQRLHHDWNSIVILQEGLRLQVSAIKAFQKFIEAQRTEETSRRFSNSQGPVLGGLRVVSSAHQLELENRIQDYLDNLQNNQETSKVIHKQLEILQSLAFNTEAVRQGYAVARLNYLAVAFLPLSFVASLFGMTQFSIKAAWYPLWACICIALVLIAIFLFSRRSQAGQSRNTPRPWSFQQWEMPIFRLRSGGTGTGRSTSPLTQSIYEQENFVKAQKTSTEGGAVISEFKKLGVGRSESDGVMPGIPENNKHDKYIHTSPSPYPQYFMAAGTPIYR